MICFLNPSIRVALATVFIIFLFSNEIQAQKQQSIYIEIFGNAVFGSVNYELDFTEDKWGGRIGVGISELIIVPVMVRKLFGKDGKYFEVGGGITYLKGISDFGGVHGTMSFQYRKQPVNDGLTWKIGLTPLIGTKAYFLLRTGASIGYTLSLIHI